MSSVESAAGSGVPVAASRAATKPNYITWTALALMTVSSVASLRPAPTMAVYGLACVFLYVLPAIVFLIPTSLVSAELASGWKGGVYRWVTEGISPNMGFVAAWHQYAMTIFYYPTLLSFVASTLAYVIYPEWASSGVWTAVVIISVYWLGVVLALRGGIGVIAKLASSGVLIGTLIPGALLVILGIVYLAQGNPSAAPMNADHLLPAWNGIASIVLIVSNFGAYSGMEMNAVHVNEFENPSKQFPKAMFFATILVLLHPDPSAAGDQLVHPGRGTQPDSRGHAGVRCRVRSFRHPVLDPDCRPGDRQRVPRWIHDLALGPVQKPAAGIDGRRLHAAVVPEDEPERRPDQHPGRSGRDHHHPGTAVRLRSGGFGRVLDVHDDHDVGLPADVSVDVPCRNEPAETTAGPPARLSFASTQPAVRHGHGVIGSRDPDQLRAAVAIRWRQPGGIHPHRWRRDPPARAGDPVPADPAPQTDVAAHTTLCFRGGIMSHRAIYWIVGGVMAVLLAVMLITFNYNRYNQEAAGQG